MIHLLTDRATSTQIQEMLQEYENMLKIVVDIRPRLRNRNILIQDETLRKQVESITREIPGGVI